MFKRLSGLIFGMICLSSCSPLTSESVGVAVHYDLNATTVSVECKGKVGFKPADGITNVIIEDLRAIADEVCGSPSTSYKEHLSSEIEKSGTYLKSAKIEFSCGSDFLVKDDSTEKLSHLCKEAFEKFDAQQD